MEALRVGLGVAEDSVDARLGVTGGLPLDPVDSFSDDDRSVSRRRRGSDSWEAIADTLASLLFHPEIVADLPPDGELVIIPHGVLNLVPFALLSPPGLDGPMGLSHALRYAPSVRAMLAAESSRGPVGPGDLEGARLLIVGDPAMPDGVFSSSGEVLELGQLPGAAAEADSVSRLLGTTYLTGEAASETAVGDRLGQAQIVHLATHGYAYSSEAQTRESFVALASGERDDGLLTLAEVMAGPDLSAELVVLSACQTGLGNLRQAEGTVGFQRAFLAKRARSVLVSEWNVSDEATRILMQRFYTHWLTDRDRPGKAESLRRAQMDVIEAGYDHPSYWAAFQLVGAR
jgi:hypothetical protein